MSLLKDCATATYVLFRPFALLFCTNRYAIEYCFLNECIYPSVSSGMLNYLLIHSLLTMFTFFVSDTSDFTVKMAK